MIKDKEKIKKEQQQIIGVIPLIDMKHFVLLLLADLASKSPIIYFDGRNTKTACLGMNYKEIIEDIMYQENGWGIKFATLINIYSYYEYQSDWEKKLGRTIENVLRELKKELIYDLENDRILIDFTKEEIENIKSGFDEETLENMDHFTNLISGPETTRTFKLEMNEMNQNINRGMYQYHQSLVYELRRRGIKNPKKYIGEFTPNESRY